MTTPLPSGPARDAVLVAREALLQAVTLQIDPILEAIDEKDGILVDHLQELNLLLGFDESADLGDISELV